ncbi:MAG: CPBP family glutamic-type intramembrane protease [Candidatus Methanofastidiosia archaeon]
MAIPFMAVGSRMAVFRAYYPRFYFGSWTEFLYWEALIGILMLSTEFFYRGFMLFGLKEFGKFSIIIQAIPYTFIHLGKPLLEVYYSFFAGAAFGYIDWDSRSILPSFVLHWTTSVIFDILCII